MPRAYRAGACCGDGAGSVEGLSWKQPLSTIYSPRNSPASILHGGNMIAFLLKVWGLVQPYRGRLFLGVAAGFLAGLIEPLMIATITSVYSLVFPGANAPELSERLKWAPPFVQDWAKSAQEALATGFQSHPIAAIVLVGAIPLVILLRGLFSYLNVYFLQWAAIRAITDLRVRLFSHLLNLSASFFSRASSGELISRTLSDTYALHGII